MPEISVIVPVFNKEGYLRKCLDSIKDQVFSDYQLIMVDDGSTDHSLDILKEYAAADSRIVVIHTENRGVSHARNTGMEKASGRYITFVDADDEILPDYLESLYADIIAQDADMAIHGLIKVDGSGSRNSIVPPLHGKYKIEDLMGSFMEIQQKTGIYGYCVSKMFSASLARGLEFDTGIRLAEDYDFYLKLYNRVKSVCFSQSAKYVYHIGVAGSSMDMDDERIDYYSQLLINIRCKDFLISKNAYNGTNKSLIDQMISRYTFLTLFNCPDDCFEQRFTSVVQLTESCEIDPYAEKGIRKQVLSAVKKKDRKRCSTVINSYKLLRNIMRKIRGSKS